MAHGRRRKDRITIYSNLVGGCLRSHGVIQAVSRSEAERMREANQIRVFCRHCGRDESSRCSNAGGHHMIGQFREKLREQVGRPGTITLAEIYANAGLFGESHTSHLTSEQRSKRERAGHEPEDFVERAAAKISQYRMTGDDLAVRA